MTLGEKIKKYRILKGLTQKELGLAVGFSAATADSRIRKYERDLIAPKDDIRIKLAKALEVDLSAISDIDVATYEDVMQVLFLFEEELGMTIERTEEKTSLCFDNRNKDHALLLSYLYTWFSKRRSVIGPDGSSDEDGIRQYERWKARFPKDNRNYWAEQEQSLTDYYDPLVKEAAKSQKPVVYLSDFILHIRELIRNNIQMEASTALFGVGDSGLVLTFPVTPLISSEDSDAVSAFTGFLYDLRTLESYGMPVTTTMLTNEKGTQISYCLRLSSLSGMYSTIIKLQAYEHEEGKNDWDIQMFEKQFEADLKTYELNLKEEIALRK